MEQTLNERVMEILETKLTAAIADGEYQYIDGNEDAANEISKLILSEKIELLTDILRTDVSDFPMPYGTHDVIHLGAIKDRKKELTNQLNQLK